MTPCRHCQLNSTSGEVKQVTRQIPKPMAAWSEASGNVSRTQSFQKSLPPSLHCHYDLQYSTPLP